MAGFVHEEEEMDLPAKYLPIHHLYSPVSPCAAACGSSKVVSKKVKARRLVDDDDDREAEDKEVERPLAAVRRKFGEGRPILVYHRQRKKYCPSSSNGDMSRVLEASRIGSQPHCEPIVCEDEEKMKALGVENGGGSGFFSDSADVVQVYKKRRRSILASLLGSGKGNRNSTRSSAGGCVRVMYSEGRRRSCSEHKDDFTCIHKQEKWTKKWVELVVDGVDPQVFIGLRCKVFWPLDDDWYKGSVHGFDPESKRHNIVYDDGDVEDIVLSNERVKFNISSEKLHQLNLKCRLPNLEENGLNFDEMLSLAINTADSQFFQPGDIVWVKLTGHAMWPAVIVNDSPIEKRKDLKPRKGNQSILVQFFGTHDFARVNPKQAVPFLDGLLLSLHQKCKQMRFCRSLDEAKMYLKKHELPRRMLRLRNIKECNGPFNDDNGVSDSVGNDVDDETILEREKAVTVEALDGSVQVANFSESKLNGYDLSSYQSSLKLPRKSWDIPLGYRAVQVDWKDLDRCSVCHMDEEYEDNLFLQCEKCRIMVHAKCFGEVEPVDGILWLCNLCRSGSPEVPPRCCLCPITGGVMKHTTDGRWAHLACAMWIPETCLLDVKRMEPIDGISRVKKDRWKLLCCICGVSYGACIQCSNRTCRVAYHPLCARAAGLCVELEGEDNLNVMLLHEDDDHCIRLLSFCKKHRQPSVKFPSPDDHRPPSSHSSCCIHTNNPSGCARSQSYESYRKSDSQASSMTRCFVQNTPFLVSGCRRNVVGSFSYDESAKSIGLFGVSKLTPLTESFETMLEKYQSMKETFRRRLTFGKSGIHGFGVFTKVAHKAGDMVIEYTGELVRSSIADIREHTIYNALVGAGTYMFRIDDECVVDATRAGSMAHLINHSCEPNCFSRMISVYGSKHIIIFAKRDISQWEELTYDYRYFSIDKQLACNCGFPRCRGIVNDAEIEEHVTKIRVPQSDVTRCDIQSSEL